MNSRDFKLISSRELPELNTEGELYRHRTGAELLSLRSEDENKVFGITFKTPPSDSTGIAHILEHSVLCGSEKYPVKEPFVELLKGSLKTFLNAFTYPDRTCYPVASQNEQDFYNLVDVYLDAVFHPRLTPQVLQQEGWHYELENRDDPLVYKGVVFNEMKGAYSSPDSVLMESIQQSLFPDTTYGVDSGGHPAHIPDLTYEQFESFHSTLYHPANARIYFYGDDDPDRRFEILESFLSEYETLDVDAAIASQPRFDAPKRLQRTYAANDDAPEGNKSMVAVNWLLEAEIDTSTGLALQILDHILTATPASPLRKTLIDSGLGEDLAGGGMESELMEYFYSTGLKGVADGDDEKVEQLVIETLQELADNGIDSETIAAAMNTTEFRLRENNTGSYPRGLIYMLRSLAGWLYGRDPFEGLAYEAPLQQLKDRMANSPTYFEGLIRRYLLDNPHRTTLFLKPDTEQEAREESAETKRLEEARRQMGPEDLDSIIAATRDLKERQEAPDSAAALALLPRLTLADLDKEIRRIPIETWSADGATVHFHDLFTNGIVYADVGFDLRALPQDLLSFIPLFGRALLEIGTEKQDFVKLTQRIGSQTGGLWPQIFVSSKRSGPPAVARFFLRGKATLQKTPELFDVVREVLLSVKLDNKERFLQMVLEEKAGEEGGIVPAGSAVASLRLRSGLDEAAWLSEQMHGVSYLFFLRQLIDDVESDWPAVLAKLERIKSMLVNRNTLVCNATFAAADRAMVEPRIRDLISAIPSSPVQSDTWRPEYTSTNEGLVIPAPINYVAKGANLYDFGYTFHGSVGVITRFLRNTWLWDRVRVQGGAYGADCSFDQFSGLFTYASYRDPNLLETIDVYDGAAGFLATLDLSDDELTKAIIGTIGELDGYQLPDAKGFASLARHLAGVDDSFRQEVRDAVLGTTAADFRAFGEVLAGVKDAGRVIVVGGREALQAPEVDARCKLELLNVL
jgi:Zn-dependent M16 (insulinase) family peptidase